MTPATTPLLKGTTEFLIAEDQFDATFGAGKQHENRVQAEVIAAEQQLARAKNSGDPGAIRVAEARREQARKEHDALAAETDAVLTDQTIFNEW